MKGHDSILEKLNQLLTGELTAMDVYFVHSRMCENWGYQRLHERLAHEMTDETGHASRLIQRILFLEGQPRMAARLAFEVGGNVQEMLKNDLVLEESVARNLNEAIALTEELHDNGTRELLADLLVDTEEDHILWLETQLRMIAEIGLQEYLAEQS